MKIDEATFAEIKVAQEDGVSSTDCASELKLEEPDVIVAYSHSNFKEFRKAIVNNQALPEEDRKALQVLPAQSAYYKRLIEQKSEQNTMLKETRGWLLEQVYFLRKAVS